MYGRILRALGHLTGLMILGSAGWTAFNVLALLGTRNPLGYAVAVMFDAAWLIAVAVQHELRFRVDWRRRLATVSWALAGLAAAINATSELLGHHGVAVAVIAALVPPLAKGCLALKLLLEANSVEAKTRFTALTQSWQDQVTELRIGEAMSAQWHRVERLHENADAQRLAVTQADRLSNLELTSGTELPLTRTAEPVVWEKPVTMPLAPLFREPVRELAEDGSGVDIVRLVTDEAADGAPGALHGAPQVNELSKADAINVMALWLGPDASSADIVTALAHQGVTTSDGYVRNTLSRLRKAAEKPDRPPFGFR